MNREEKRKKKILEKDLRKRIRSARWFTALTFIICLTIFIVINFVIRSSFLPYLYNIVTIFLVLLLIYFGLPWLFAKILTYRAG